MRNAQIEALNGFTDSGSSPVLGAAIDVGQVISASFQVVSNSSDAAGTVKIQMSNDNPGPNGKAVQGNFVPTNWTDVTSATIAVSSGAGPALILATVCYRWLRVVYTRSGGGASDKYIKVNMNTLGV